MTDGPEGSRQVEAMLNGQMTMVDFDRIGVALVPQGILPRIIELPDEYEMRDRVRSQFDHGSHIPLAEDLGRRNLNLAHYRQLG